MSTTQPAPRLPPAPAEVHDGAALRLGAYEGSFGRVELAPFLSGAGGLVRRVTQRKRWVWTSIMTGEVIVSFAIVDAGYASNAFLLVVDRASGRAIADRSWLGTTRSVSVNELPGAGARAWFRGRGVAIFVERQIGAANFDVSIDAGDLALRAGLDASGATPPIAIVMPMGSGRFDCTQKTVLLPSAGTLKLGAANYSLDGGRGGFDYTHGLLPRNTSWRWAFAMGTAADGTEVALNLSHGMSSDAVGDGVRENAIWIGGALVPVGEARFEFDKKNPIGPWRVVTADGALDLRFESLAAHREERNLVVLKSHFVQIAGHYTGTLRGPDGRTIAVERLPGFAEDQDVLW